jgi:hypothetical protein
MHKTDAPSSEASRSRFLAELDARKMIHVEGPIALARRYRFQLDALEAALEIEAKSAAPGSDTRAKIAGARSILSGAPVATDGPAKLRYTLRDCAQDVPPPVPEPRTDGRLLSALLERTADLAAGLEALLIVANGKNGLAAKLDAIEKIGVETIDRIEAIEARAGMTSSGIPAEDLTRIGDVELDATGSPTWDWAASKLKLRDAQIQALVSNGVLIFDAAAALFHRGRVELAAKRWAPIAKALASDLAVDWAAARAALTDQALMDEADAHGTLRSLEEDDERLSPPVPMTDASIVSAATERNPLLSVEIEAVADRRTLSAGGL